MSDYDRVLTAYNYLRSNCSYAYKGWQYNYANTAWGALVYGEAQCSGYARAMKALCDAIGVDCRYVHADSKASNPSHQWNQVRVGGKWYILMRSLADSCLAAGHGRKGRYVMGYQRITNLQRDGLQKVIRMERDFS